jgi:hypothetical protein
VPAGGEIDCTKRCRLSCTQLATEKKKKIPYPVDFSHDTSCSCLQKFFAVYILLSGLLDKKTDNYAP